MSDINITVNDEIVNIDIVDEPVLVNVVNSPGVPGAPGQGVPVGGTTGQVLAKNSNTNYDTEWVDVSGGVWGTITGTLSNQTDLQNALNAKVPYTGATANVDLGEYELKAGQVEFDQTPTGTAGVGVIRWNDSDGTLDLGLKGGNVTLQVGQEQVARVVNKSGVNLLESAYQVVKVTDAQGQRLAVDLAQGNNDANSTDTIGIVTENIDNNQEGFITTSGIVRNINTTGSLQGETWNDGDVLYLSPTTAGAITNIKPTAPNHTVILGYVVYAHAVNGKIFVKCDNGYELGELHDVYVPTPSNNDGIFWNSTNLRYENKSVSSALGYTPANSATTLTINGVTYDLSTSRTWTISTGISGSGASGQVAYWNGTTSQAGSSTFLFTPTSVFDVSNSVTSASAIARGTRIRPTLTASANNDVLVGLDIDPTFTNGSFTGVRNIPLRVGGTTITQGGFGDNLARVRTLISNLDSGTYTQLAIQGPTNGGGAVEIYDGSGNAVADFGMNTFAKEFGFVNRMTSGFINLYTHNGTSLASRFHISTLGNILIQNGGTFTDSGERLQVTGTMKVTGNSTFGTIGSGTGMYWDNTNNRLAIGTSIPTKTLVLSKSFGVDDGIVMSDTGGGYFQVTNSSGLGFQPIFQGQGRGNFSSLIFKGLQTATASPTTTVTRFISRAGDDSSAVSGVNPFTFENGTSTILALTQNNNLILQNGGTFTDVNSALMQLTSTTKGFLPPRMTTTQKNAISSPAAGLVVYDTTLAKLCVYTTAWETITSI